MYKPFSADDHTTTFLGVLCSPEVAGSLAACRRGRGIQFWEFEGEQSLFLGLSSVAENLPAKLSVDLTRFDGIIPGAFEPVDRPRRMLATGMARSANPPTLPRFGGMFLPDRSAGTQGRPSPPDFCEPRPRALANRLETL